MPDHPAVMEPPNRREAMTLAAAGVAGFALREANGAVFNVRESPKENTPAADDTVAVEQAINRCLKAGGGVVYFPAGSYRLDKRIDVDLPPGTPLAIRGDGPGLSK